MFVCCECCVLSGRGLCDALITRPEESYGLWCVVVCDLETSRMRRPWPVLGRSTTGGRGGSQYKPFGIVTSLLVGQIHISFLGRSKNSMFSSQRTDGISHPNNSFSTGNPFIRSVAVGGGHIRVGVQKVVGTNSFKHFA